MPFLRTFGHVRQGPHCVPVLRAEGHPAVTDKRKGDLANEEPETLAVKIYETRLLGVDFDHDGVQKHVVVELWVMKENIFEEFFDRYDLPSTASCSIARMLSLNMLDRIGLRHMIQHNQAQFVMALRRKILTYADEVDLNNLVAHETAHFILGHDGTKHAEEEAEVAKELGEVETANRLFLERLNVMGVKFGRRRGK